ncbi:LPS export ABC transporter ATP-binding protein [Spirochaeta africana]|uniref:ABC-type (Unclassified) transport system, ATPase component n=1 Tax=Spirochaeta africana (strain ATCC 700263 / DSM 8902 / Z-7692) TaxID=889378 RepID=H9UMF5_SPIAZ|nr:LPS export ABC transporter ATP-binding protein [Spirochaeta africana]AFG38698.1 ABC-type (unclassified) transport system, ATPase component [Spirochaeta africana DSM 8902]
MSRLAVSDLHKSFGKKEVVRGVDMHMEAGEIVGFLGPNGAGKTTCFYMIVGFIRPSAGTILLNDHDITHRPMYQRARAGISYLPQEPSVFRKMSVEQNVWAILETRKDLDYSGKRDRLELLLDELGIQAVRHQKAFTLSGGERRRTEIARALAIEPKFLLLDEPFAGIDPIAVYEIKQIIRDLTRKNIGVLITDHNVRDTLEITNRSYVLKDGQIMVSGSRDEVMQSEVARRVYLGDTFQM